MKVVEVALVIADWETPDLSAPKLPACDLLKDPRPARNLKNFGL
jgi:hypothetical protein